MKPFKCFLKEKLEEYIAYRKELGYADKHIRSSLLPFDRYVLEKNVDKNSFTPLFFLKFREELKVTPNRANIIIGATKRFFQFLVRRNIYIENPLQDVPAYKEKAFIPFIFSTEETEHLLNAVQKRLSKSEATFLDDLAVYMVILLLARCGLRISEPLKLMRTNYRQTEGTIYIEKTKFKKDRLIPLPKPVCVEVENYLAVRKSLLSVDDNPYLFMDSEKTQIPITQIYRGFYNAVKDLGINQEKRIIANTIFGAPTPHSLRHSFAINTLKQIKEKGKTPQEALPVLSAYMGHKKYRYTSLYLKVLDAEHRQGLVNFAISQIEEV